ncbi:hypothetical protein T08_13144 [Trichinella sp. T8]|nr:hypothetical protein T08_13144 [Trichinella sp. T8]
MGTVAWPDFRPTGTGETVPTWFAIGLLTRTQARHFLSLHYTTTVLQKRQRLLKLNEQKTGAIECHVSFPLTPMCTMGISEADRGTEQPLGGSFNVPSVRYSGIHFYCHCSPVCSSTKKAIVASVWWPACFWTNGQLNPPCGADTSRHNSVYCDKNVSVSMRQNRPRSSLV